MGGCLPLAESVPFLPITEALYGLSPGGPPPALDRCAAHVRTELGRLMPGWSDTAVPEPSAEWARAAEFAPNEHFCQANLYLSLAISVTEALRPAKPHENRATIAAVGSGKVERLLKQSRPYICLIRSVRVGRISGRLCLLWER